MIDNKKLIETRKELEETKKEIRTIKFRKGLKTVLDVSITLSALITPIALYTIVASHFNHSPFIKDTVLREIPVKIEFDSEGKLEVTEQNDLQTPNNESILEYYDGWTIDGDEYITNERVYDISKLDYYTVSECLDKNGQPDESIIGGPIFKKTITKSELPENVELGEPFYDGIIYETDKKSFRIDTQTDLEAEEDVMHLTAFSIGSLATGVIVVAKSQTKKKSEEELLDERKLSELNSKKKKLLRKIY